MRKRVAREVWLVGAGRRCGWCCLRAAAGSCTPLQPNTDGNLNYFLFPEILLSDPSDPARWTIFLIFVARSGFYDQRDITSQKETDHIQARSVRNVSCVSKKYNVLQKQRPSCRSPNPTFNRIVAKMTINAASRRI